MEIDGPLAPPCAGRRLAPSLVRQADPRRERAELTMFRLPVPGVLSDSANAPIETPPCPLAAGCLHHRLPVSRQATVHTGKTAIVQDAAIPGPQRAQGLEHDVRVS
jgi:hypothetical protein